VAKDGAAKPRLAFTNKEGISDIVVHQAAASATNRLCRLPIVAHAITFHVDSI